VGRWPVGVPVCWCTTLHGHTMHIVSSPEECRRLEEHLKGKAWGPVFCRYEEYP
jgi:hypothetical protein